MKPDRPEEEKKNKHMWVALWPLLFLVLAFQFGKGQSALTKSMGISQRLGDKVPKNLTFKDENGKPVQIGSLLQGRPVVVVPIFYSCRTGCALLTDSIMKTLARATKTDTLKPGRDLDVLMYSIDPAETPDLAHAKKSLIFNSLTPRKKTPEETAQWRKDAERGWHLLTGMREDVQALSTAIGFKYDYKTVPDLEHRKTINLINHPTCTAFLTPSGTISSYTIGTEFHVEEVQSNLAVAMNGQIGHAADQSWMFGCVMLDPMTGRNRVVIENVWRLLGVITLLVLSGSVISMFVKNHRENLAGGGGLSTR